MESKMNHLEPSPQFYGAPFIANEFNGMPYRLLGSSGLRVSNVGLGTWKFGFPEKGDGSRVDEKAAFKIMDRAIELGVTHWDTANRYNNSSGNSERIIGKWLHHNPDQRRNVVLATKMFGGMDGVTPNHSRLSRANILDSVYASLARMQINTVDVLYFHRFDNITPVEESLAAVEDMISRDLVRYLAVSNFSVDQLKIYKSAMASASIRSAVVAVQNQFDILNGESNAFPGVLDYCAESRSSFVAWSPLARGLITDRYLKPSEAGKGDRLYDEGTIDKDATEEKMTKVKKLDALAKGWDLSVSQLALAYMLSLPGMGPVIPSSSSVEQLESNAHAGKVTLDTAQLQQVHEIIV